MTLHDAITFTLTKHGGRMTVKRLTADLNNSEHYVVEDGPIITEHQVRARARIFNHLFKVTDHLIELKYTYS